MPLPLDPRFGLGITLVDELDEQEANEVLRDLSHPAEV